MITRDFDDHIEEEKDHILKKDCWSIYDASFLLTSFYVEDCNNGENERQQRNLGEMLQASIHAKKLIPDYESNYFKPATIIKWAIERKILREGAFSSFLEKNNENIEIKESPNSNSEDDAIRKYIENVLKDFPAVTSKHIVSHCFDVFSGNTRKITLIKEICSEVGVEMDKSNGRPSQEMKEYIASAPKYQPTQ